MSSPTTEFNMKIAELLKAVAPEDIVTILTDAESLIRSTQNHQQNNMKPKQSTEE